MEQSGECQVCKKPDARIHYNGQVCNGCRVFFFRAVINETQLKCPRENACPISYIHGRENCPACRLKKCYEAKMKSKEVGVRKNARAVTTFTQSDVDSSIQRFFGSIMNNGARGVVQLKNIYTVTATVDYLDAYFHQILSVNGPSASTVSVDTSIPLSDLFMFPGSCMDRTTVAFDYFSKNPLPEAGTFRHGNALCRGIILWVEGVHLVEEIHRLDIVDKIRLLQNNCRTASLLLSLHHKYKKRVDDTSYLRYIDRFKRPEPSTQQQYRTNAVTHLLHQRIQEIFYETQITDKEMLLLWFIIGCRPALNMSDEGRAIAIQARVRLTHLLGEFMRGMWPFSSQYDLQKRVTKLLELENYAREVADHIRDCYVQLILQDHQGLRTPLFYDYVVKKY